MFTVQTTDPTTRALLYLANVPDHWHPCGSRFFGDAAADSDFDFFTAHSEDIAVSLVHNQFALTFQKYRDANTVAIYSRGKVHAILARSVDDRLAAQLFFMGKPKMLRKLTKSWDDFYKSLRTEAK